MQEHGDAPGSGQTASGHHGVADKGRRMVKARGESRGVGGRGAFLFAAALSAALISFMLVLAAQAQAQEDTSAGATAVAGEAVATTNTTTTPSRADTKDAEVRAKEGPERALQASGPLAGKAMIVTEAEDAALPDPLVVVVRVAGCAVEEGASVTVRDANGTRGTVTDGAGAEITGGPERVLVKGPEGEEPIEGLENPEGELTVVRSQGIVCEPTPRVAAEETAAEQTSAAQQATGCPAGTSEVERFSGDVDDFTPLFRISGDTWRYLVTVTPKSTADDNEFVSTEALDDNGTRLLLSGVFASAGDENQSSSELEGPGSFSLGIDVSTDETVNYEIVICDNAADAPNNPQGNAGPLVGAKAVGRDTNQDRDCRLADGTVADCIDLITIEASGCDVQDDATVSIKDEDGDVGRLVDGNNVEISDSDNGIRIVGTGQNNRIVPIEVSGDRLDGSVLTVTRTTGITGDDCKAADVANDNVNRKKALPDTGGSPVLSAVVPALLLPVAAVSVWLLRRRWGL
jgi:hypothetical protein